VKEKAMVIPFGVDLAEFDQVDSERVRSLQEHFGRFVLFVGRLGYYKGLPMLLEAIANTQKTLVLIGDGPERSSVQTQIQELRIGNRVHLLPPQSREDLLAFLHASEMLVLPSTEKSEAFGIVLIEAMACGKPVISTELGTGTSWVNQDGVTGIVVPPRDAVALQRAIGTLEEESMSKRLGEQARERVEGLFTREKMLHDILFAYETRKIS
jgi:rhamnosyl/mannosyltransferase